jgi:hypothetical protein
VPNWLDTCCFATASTVLWISLCGVDGVKTWTFGPRFGTPGPA